MSLDVMRLQTLHFLKVLSNELRWELIRTLIRSDYRVQELVVLLRQPQNLVSYHLKQLRDAHLVVERRSTADARDIYYSLNLAQLHTYYTAVGDSLHPALTHTEPDIDVMSRAVKTPTKILFLCTENSARSQMAEGITRFHTGKWVNVFSAGTAPSKVHPFAINIMAEMGIDISQQRAKHIDDLEQSSFDYIITLCDQARESCSTFKGNTELIHWSFADPVAVDGDKAQYFAFKEIAQQLNFRIRNFLALVGRDRKESR